MLRYLLLCLLPQLCWAQLPDLNSCEIANSGFGYFDLTVHEPLLINVYGPNSQITYHVSMAGATMPGPAIVSSQNFYGQDGQIIYARTHDQVTNEFSVDTFTLHADAPQPTLPSDAVVCMNIFGATINPVLLQSGLDNNNGYSFSWTYNGQPIANEYNNNYLAWLPGNYGVMVTKDGCSNTVFADVIAATAPYSASASQNGNTVTITVAPAGEYQYALDNNSTFFDSPVFDNVLPGPHIGFVRDLYGCSELAFSFDSTLDVAQQHFQDLKLGPNPMQDRLMISNGHIMDAVEIFNAVGQRVLIKQIANKQAQIDVSGLASGFYCAKIRAGDQWHTKTLIRQ